MIEILTVYTKLNGVQYVQGMNEILALVMFVMRNEPDTFWSFSAIMSQLNDMFTAEADSTVDGIYSRIDQLYGLLAQHDFRLSKHLDKIDFPLATLAMRWMTTLLAMDVNLPDATRVWDFALQSIRTNCLLLFSSCLSLAYLIRMSADLRTITDRQEAMEYASNYGKGSDMDVDALIVDALSIFAYESILRGKYTPISDEPILEALGDVVLTARDRLAGVLDGAHTETIKHEITDKVKSVKSAMSSWFGSLASQIPRAPVVAKQEINVGTEARQ